MSTVNQWGDKHPPTQQMQDIYDATMMMDEGHIVEAGAGSGKTTLLEGIYNRLNIGEQLLVTSFTRRITGELALRMPNAFAKGFHALSYGVLKGRHRYLRWGKDSVNKYKYQDIAKELKIARMFPDRKEEEAHWLLEQVIHFIMADLAIPEPEHLDELADRFALTLPGDLATTAEAIARMMAVGREQTFEQARINFDEMIYYTVVEQWPLPKFRVVAVDEWQDTNAMQMGLVELIQKDMLIAVGDKRQSIFLFAGARTDAMDQGREVFGLTPKPLTFCFRCGKNIVKHAQKWMPELQSPDWMHEGSVNLTKRSQLVDRLRSGDAILCRTNAPCVSLCFELIAMGIKAHIRGKDIGQQLIQLITKIAGSQYAGMENFPDQVAHYREKEANRIIKQGGKRVPRLLGILEDKTRCIMTIYDEVMPTNVGQMRKKIDMIFTDTPGPGIQLMTVHGSKGLEFPVVYIIEPQLMPLSMPGMTDEQLQQELNLCGVAATRAINELNYVIND